MTKRKRNPIKVGKIRSDEVYTDILSYNDIVTRAMRKKDAERDAILHANKNEMGLSVVEEKVRVQAIKWLS